MTKAGHLVGGHRLWSNLERDGIRQVKMPKTCLMMSTPRKPGSASDGEEWQTAQHGIPMTSSGLKAKEEEYA